MARTRSLKPLFFHDVDLLALPPLARLLFSGLWCYADREGRLEDIPRQLKHDILPDDQCDVNELLEVLAAGNKPFIIRYEIDDRRFIQIRSFNKHQNPHPKETPSVIPPLDLCEQAASRVKDVTGPVKEIASPSSSLLPSPSSGFPSTAIADGKEASASKEQAPPTELETTIQENAAIIHGQHPQPRRDCSVKDVATALRLIVKQFPAASRISEVIAIRERHTGLCGYSEWQKEGGVFAKGLSNWLAPRKGRYMIPAPDEPKGLVAIGGARASPAKFQTKAEQRQQVFMQRTMEEISGR